jgi:hypothetical protein
MLRATDEGLEITTCGHKSHRVQFEDSEYLIDWEEVCVNISRKEGGEDKQLDFAFLGLPSSVPPKEMRQKYKGQQQDLEYDICCAKAMSLLLRKMVVVPA